MNSFRTPLNFEPAPFSINHRMKGLAMGSCFVENIGGWLRQVKFNVILNPFGIAYNPKSIGKHLSLLLAEGSFPVDHIFQHNERWHSFDHHSSFSGSNKKKVVEKINIAFTDARTQLQKADYLLITFGTAHVHSHKKNNQIVSNCHKIPSTEFDKKRLSVNEIVNDWEPILQKLKDTAPNVNVLFTVSPIRHLKDGIVENQKSKATLLLAIDYLVQQFDSCHYFPAYEIMMDDLRGYRFYAKDMIHPNEVAIEYIKDKFATAYFMNECSSVVGKIEAIQNAVDHRPFHPNSDAHQLFLKKTLDEISMLEREYKFNFSAEKDSIHGHLMKFNS